MDTPELVGWDRSTVESSRLRYIGYGKPVLVIRTSLLTLRCESLIHCFSAGPDQSPPPRQPLIVLSLLSRTEYFTPGRGICKREVERRRKNHITAETQRRR